MIVRGWWNGGLSRILLACGSVCPKGCQLKRLIAPCGLTVRVFGFRLWVMGNLPVLARDTSAENGMEDFNGNNVVIRPAGSD